MITKVYRLAEQIIQSQLETGKSVQFALELSNELKTDYQELNNLFLARCHMSLEVIFLKQIVEKVKELLVYTEQPLSQIANALGYEKSSDLSEQLMRYTGLTSAHFKRIRKIKLENIRRQQKKI
ncbi:helix-turn-helix domain-containing protein [Sphingobacterium sp. BIGb0165]|uniref:helix-turn-helix domain-containing protein n=1 Tax=Sphingobacterium sp. BIGb0165 TaxID=2940615 RepID=UPI00216A9593|nr:helix-turn-helix domain-containing protein [Sphingobacterium sp. BIGb0165]MCS4226295.1 methylphosphotriester-DNA--protein-cysteine methyltransferase [Sphingobacterium sp. BIGb0165]